MSSFSRVKMSATAIKYVNEFATLAPGTRINLYLTVVIISFDFLRRVYWLLFNLIVGWVSSKFTVLWRHLYWLLFILVCWLSSKLMCYTVLNSPFIFFTTLYIFGDLDCRHLTHSTRLLFHLFSASGNA